jgi:DNA-binding MarR family transcriptional regulator
MTGAITPGLGTQLRHLIELLDGDLERIYADDGAGYRPRFTPVVRVLLDREACSIKEIADAAGISHSASSQTVSLMVREGWVRSRKGPDARGRLVRLTTKGRRYVPILRRHWAATKQAAETLDRELSHPLSAILDEAIQALSGRAFRDRIAAEADALESDD